MPEYEFKAFFTKHMQYCGGIAPTLLMAVLIIDIIKFIKIKNNLTFAAIAFRTSILVFFAGGLIGILISGVNLSIPAHYHGSIVGISIGFLGFTYIFCFRNSVFAIPDQTLNTELFVFSPSSKQTSYDSNNLSSYSKWPNIQLIIITFGQLLHITGLALAGEYGILRKNPEGG